MKKLFFLLACVVMSVLSMAQVNQLVWANGRLLYGSPITNVDSLTYDESAGMDTLLLPRVLIKEVHDTVYVTQVVHDTVYVEADCGGEGDTPSAGIGVFSVGEGKTVTFSPGNLQYTQSTDTWSFAENQWDYIGTDNVTGGSVSSDSIRGDFKSGTALADKIDLFGWSTTATNFGASTSTYDYGGVDWGTNKIGSDAPNTWRKLSYDEGEYLLKNRPNASSLKGVAQVNGVNGLILLPDNWVCPSDITFKSGFHSNHGVDYYAAYQTFTAEQWSKLESAGAVFLPAAGFRNGSSVSNVQSNGYYWFDNFSHYNFLYFFSGSAGILVRNHDHGLSVRLVKDL